MLLLAGDFLYILKMLYVIDLRDMCNIRLWLSKLYSNSYYEPFWNKSTVGASKSVRAERIFVYLPGKKYDTRPDTKLLQSALIKA